MPDEKEYLTKEKFEELGKELEDLKKNKRREVADNLEYAKSMGDLSENAEYQEATEIMTEHHGSFVDVGTTVVLEKEKDGTQYTYKIVGSEESDVSGGKISNHSPLGSAIVGKKKGDSFTFNTPGGKVSYKIVTVK